MAGHSKWANIKHRKGRQDALRGKKNTKLIREITVASREGGADPKSNPRLRLAIAKAYTENVTKDSIQRAIDKGIGHTDGGSFLEVIYEGYGPNGVAILVSCLTDNRNRTVAEVRHAFTKHGGNLGTDGSVAYLFERVGYLRCRAQGGLDVCLEALMDLAIDDIDEDVEGDIVVKMSPSILADVLGVCEARGYTILQSDVIWLAKADVAISDSTEEALGTLVQALDALDDVQAVFHNAECE